MSPPIRELLGLVSLIGYTAVAVRLFGSKPTRRDMVRGVFLGIVFFGVLDILTSVLMKEGVPGRQYLLFFLGVVAIFAAIKPLERATVTATLLLILGVFLCYQHLQISTSPFYTDTPSARMRYFAMRKISAQKNHQPPPRPIQMEAKWYTLLTGLYCVSQE